MRKGAIVLMMGVLAVASAWATDLNPNAGRAQAMGKEGIYPWNQTPSFLWARGDACPDMGYVDVAYDDEYWNYADTNDQPYLYAIYKFYKPSGFSSGDLRWRIWGNSGFEITLWRWNPNNNTWVDIDSVTGTFPDVRTIEDIPASWFNEENELYILSTVATGTTTHNIISDQLDIQY